MDRFKIDFRYLKSSKPEYYRTEGKILPSANAIFWCMVATSVYRIFTREDMEEFLFRLAIILNIEHLTEDWLTNNRLMSYQVNDQSFFLLSMI